MLKNPELFKNVETGLRSMGTIKAFEDEHGKIIGFKMCSRMKRIVYIILIIFFFCNAISPKALAAIHPGFSTEPLSAVEIDTFLRNVKLSPLPEEPKRKPIVCFDVDDERIAVGCEESDHKTVCVYTTEGAYQYGWRFPCDGSFGVELEGENLILYFARSDIAVMINLEGKIESLAKIQNTSDNNSYWNHHVHAISREVGDIRYTLKNDLGIFNLFASTYSRLTATGADSVQHVLYDVRAEQLAKMIFVTALVLTFTTIAVAVLIREFKKLKRENRKKPD